MREARRDARLLLMVVRARLAEGRLPTEHVEALARVAQDERVGNRLRLGAAELLARMRLSALAEASAVRRVGSAEAAQDRP